MSSRCGRPAARHLGGDDFDKRVVDWLADEFKRDQGIDLRNDPQALQRLYEAAERAKVELSTTTQTQINLPFVTADAAGPKHLNLSLTRSEVRAADRGSGRAHSRPGGAGAVGREDDRRTTSTK